MIKYQHKIVNLIKKIFPDLEVVITTPPNSEMGDLALPCFSFAKQLKKSPMEISNDIKNKLHSELDKIEFIDRIEAAGGYLNFFINRSMLIKDIIEEIKEKKDKFGSTRSGVGKKALIEHTSINPNASPHVGRARNALIGDVLVRLLKFEDYEVDVNYFVNDIGKQIAMLLLGAKDKNNIAFNELLDIYVDINSKVEKNPELEKEVFELLYKLENGDDDVKARFREVVDTCIKGQTKILNELDINYDTFKYESDYIWDKRTNEILDELKKTGKLEEDSEGRFVLNQEEYNLPMKAPYLVLTRADKTSLYPLRDIAYSIDKIKSSSEKNIIVLGEDQKLYFQQIKAVLDLLGHDAPTPVHYSFILLTDGKMSTRKGAVVLLEDFMKEALTKAIDGMKSRHANVDEQIAKSIAYGAVRYAVLRVANEKNVTFDWNAALSFEGDAGPYLQYSYARINSIFRKYGKELPQDIDYSLLKEAIEYEIIKDLANFDSVIIKALDELSPHIIANYVYGLTKKFSLFYHECPVMNAKDEELMKSRLVLIDAIRQVIRNCLNILGIDTVEFM